MRSAAHIQNIVTLNPLCVPHEHDVLHCVIHNGKHEREKNSTKFDDI